METQRESVARATLPTTNPTLQSGSRKALGEEYRKVRGRIILK
jgi:hypothetical protein